MKWLFIGQAVYKLKKHLVRGHESVMLDSFELLKQRIPDQQM
jgi:hypothetical protein